MGPEERVLRALEKVKDAASFILEVTERKTLEEYSHDRLLRQAIVLDGRLISETIEIAARGDGPSTESTRDPGT